MIPYSRPKLSYFFYLYLFKTLKKRGRALQNIGNKKYNIFLTIKSALLLFFENHTLLTPNKEQATVFQMFRCYRKSWTGNTPKAKTRVKG